MVRKRSGPWKTFQSRLDVAVGLDPCDGLGQVRLRRRDRDLGKLTGSGKNPLSDAQVAVNAASLPRGVAEGDHHDGEFRSIVSRPVRGTSSNMNVQRGDPRTEPSRSWVAIAFGGEAGPSNDHVNMGQSTNDIFPTAIHVAVGMEVKNDLIPSLQRFADTSDPESQGMGQRHQDRPHALDGRDPVATGPGDRRIGSAVGAFGPARPAGDSGRRGIARRRHGRWFRINTHPEFGTESRRCWRRKPEFRSSRAVDHFEANAQRDALVACHGQLRTVATTLFNVANNIRWLGVGSRLLASSVIVW